MYRQPIHPHQGSKFYDSYYARQVGSGLPVYHGGPIQYGEGLGNLLSSLFRSALPLLKKGAATLGKTVLHTGADIMEDAMSGRNVKTSIKNRVRQAGRTLGSRAVGEARSRLTQKGKGRTKGRRRTRKGRKVIKKERAGKSFIRRKVGRSSRQKTPDIFGY